MVEGLSGLREAALALARPASAARDLQLLQRKRESDALKFGFDKVAVMLT